MQDRVRLDFRWFRGLQRQVQGRRLLQGPPRPHHQTVDSPLPPPRRAPRPSSPAFLNAPYVHPTTPPCLVSPEKPPHLTAPHLLQHTAARPKAPGTIARTFTVASKTSSRCAPPSHTPVYQLQPPNISAPAATPQLQPLPSYNPLATHPSPQHAITQLNPTCQHTSTQPSCPAVDRRSSTPPRPRLNRGS